ncbi:hypothetical protein [Streptomyces sp. ME19-01-6]|uniref:hypothetical protein n=1 Tax=Streptomyces sp. ME19-01-6 TaxID=3028686 RepID=UPI0029AE6EF9|nr:hypothetical protein [Streptomyces sp. ME19-01-6]MDX3226131.1 hypothetical protein [Streptomyces sp. ME19-01-6]
MADHRRRTRRTSARPSAPGPVPLWREAARRAVVGLAATVGPVTVAVVQWWLRVG